LQIRLLPPTGILGGGAPAGGGGGYWENTINSDVPVRVFIPPPPGAAPPHGGELASASFFSIPNVKFCFFKTSRPVFQGQLLGFSPISLKNLALRQAKTHCKSLLVRALSYSASPK